MTRRSDRGEPRETEEPGLFVLTAETPQGATGTATTLVGEDECHVQTEQLRLVVK